MGASAAGDGLPRGEVMARLGVLMATVFVDMIGFLIVLPLLPFYAERLGASPFLVGGLVSAFAVAQLAASPLWGRLSDHYGRRPVILISLWITTLAFILFEAADAVWLLFLSRAVQGLGAGTVGVVQAYLSDSVPASQRSQALGWLTAATSAGVMLGPAVGSLAAATGVVPPGYLAAGLCVANWLFAFRYLKEPQTEHRSDVPREPGGTRRVIAEIIRRPRGELGSLVWIYSSGMMAFMAMNGIWALYLNRRFGITEATIGWFYVYVGSISLVMRALVLGPVVRRFGEVRVLRAGTLSLAVGLGLVPFCPTLWALAPAVLLIPVGTALLFPATTSMLSGRAPRGRTGMVLGVQQLFGGVSRMLGPIWAGAVFQHLGIRSPFWVAAALMLAARLFSGAVREVSPRADARRSEPVEPTLPVEPS